MNFAIKNHKLAAQFKLFFMSSALIITLRETLEASLVVGIILAYLYKTANLSKRKYVWWGVSGGIILSIVLAWIFQKYLGGFEGQTEETYEGITMLFAAGLLSWMILWMLLKRKNLKKDLEAKVETHLQEKHDWGLVLIALISVAREGIETVIFLQAATLQSNKDGVFFGGLIGILIAIAFSYFMFKGILKIALRPFFTFTSILLILFASGLVAHGIHEFQEAGLIPIFIEHLWDTNNIIDEKGTLGSLLKGLFGYNGNPSLIEVISYWFYLAVISIVWISIEKKIKISR